MKLSEVIKRNKIYVVFVLVIVAFFALLLIRHSVKVNQLEKEYKDEIEELRTLVNITNLGASPEKEYNIYASAQDFMELFYGISKEISQEYRNEKLEELMTQEAFVRYVQNETYDNSLNYEVYISNLEIYVDYNNSGKSAVYVCVFFDENTDWTGVNAITLHKYWKGVFQFDDVSDTWKVKEIIDCQELLTREEYDAFMTDTDISTVKLGGDENADAGAGTEKNP